MKSGVIFDLDQTLVDSSGVAHLRQTRKWSEIYKDMSKIKMFPHVLELLQCLYTCDIKIAIVTTSPSIYCKRIAAHFQWKIDSIIGYHDVSPNIKPHPAGYLKATKELNLDLQKTIAVGDRDIDIIAAHRSGIVSVGCLWSSENPYSLRESNPSFIARQPLEMANVVKNFHNLL
jgi:HAD superfamily hydrolase (TIGR01662 family)